jgi:ABC-type amino acid transport substrate-binding protein
MMIWLFERRHNPDMFGGNAASGIGSGFWWSAVTMTTVGYGDKAPKTCGGRVVAIIWMFTSIIIISSFTAAITTSLTVGELEGTIRGLEDLRSARVGAVTGSSSEAFLREEGIRTRPIPSTRDGLSSLADGRLDAVVQDAPILKFLVANNFADELKIIPKTFSRQDYGIALPVGSTQRETLNRDLLEVIASPEWRRLVQRYISDS